MTVARIPKDTRVHFPGNPDSDDTHLELPPQLQSIDRGINRRKIFLYINKKKYHNSFSQNEIFLHITSIKYYI